MGSVKESKDKYKKIGYKKSDAEKRSLELRRILFDEYEARNHSLVFQHHERFSHQFERFHRPWPITIKDLGEDEPFISVQISRNTNVIETTLNRSFLNDTQDKDLIEPMAVAAIRGLDESFMRMMTGNQLSGRGMNAKETLAMFERNVTEAPSEKKRVRMKSGKKSAAKKGGAKKSSASK